jgi:CheY-like chemotaxis protein
VGKILIIDDGIELCDTFSDILTPARHEVYALHTGSEVFRILPQLMPDIVLLDMHMPEIFGVIMLEFIRHLHRLEMTKVIIVSGYPEMAAAAQKTWGADLSLAKPVTPTQLLDTVASYT